MKEQERLSWIDAAKGLAMLIIVWGHVQTGSPLKMWITSFHVPVYLVLTGYLYAGKGRMGGVKRCLANSSALI